MGDPVGSDDFVIDPELIIRVLLIGYCCAIRSERRLCEEVGVNLSH